MGEQELRELDEILNIIQSVPIYKGAHSNKIIGKNEAKTALTQLIQERERLARVEELQRLPIVKLDNPDLHKSQKYRDFGKFLHSIYLPKRLASLLKGGAE